MRVLPGLLLLAAVAAGEGRTIPEILADHAQATGDVAGVRALKSTATLRNGVTIEGVETAWRFPDQWLRRIPSPRGPDRYEHFVGGVALTVAFAEGHEVLVTPRDANGVHAVYLLDAKTHLLKNLRFEEKDNEPFVNTGWEVDIVRHGAAPPQKDKNHSLTGNSSLFGSRHPAGINVVMVDGSVHHIPWEVDAATFRNLCIRFDGNPVTLP